MEKPPSAATAALSPSLSLSLPRIPSFASLELKSHKAQVPFLAAASFRLHLSSLISILMGYSCRLAHDSTVRRRERTTVYTSASMCVCVYVRTHARVCTRVCSRAVPTVGLIPDPKCASAPPYRQIALTSSCRTLPNPCGDRLTGSFHRFPRGWQTFSPNDVTMGKCSMRKGRSFRSRGMTDPDNRVRVSSCDPLDCGGR